MADKHTKKEHKEDEEELREEHIDDAAVHEEPETSEDSETKEDKNDSESKEHEHSSKQPPHKRLWQWALNNKKFSIPAAVVVLLAVLAAVPFTRYTLAGLVMKQTYAVVVVDQETGKPVSSAKVTLGGKTAETNGEGKAEIKAKVGNKQLKVEKKYYESFSGDVLVPLGKPDKAHEVKLKALGRAVPISVVNYISKKPVANVTITAEGTEAKTDDEGKTVLVVPADKQEVEITLSGDGFNSVKAKLTVTTDEVGANTFTVTPSGKIYFLSNASGKIDLVKSNLDGTERTTVLAGTGKEERYSTVLLASRDWKYIALRSKRDGGEYSKLFLIETETDKVTTMDEGEAYFEPYGWSGDRFVYKVSRDNVAYWEQKRQTLKSYHAPTKKITSLTHSGAEGPQSGYAYELLGAVYILDQEVLFTKNWSPYNNGGYNIWLSKRATLNSIKADGSQAKVVKTYPDQDISARTAEFDEIYILYAENGDDKARKVEGYKNGKISPTD